MKTNIAGKLFGFVKEDYLKDRQLFIKKLLFTLFFALNTIVYFSTNYFNRIRFEDEQPLILIFPLIDDLIPFWTAAAVPYLYWYFYVVFTGIVLFFYKKGKYYIRFTGSMTLAVFISAIIYIVFPTHVPRPVLEGNDIFTVIMRYVHTIDAPYNCFPSMHVFYSFICFWFLLYYRKNSLVFNLFNILSFAVSCAATLLTKQHYVPDVIGGIAIGALCCYIFREKKGSGIKFPRRT